jgi:hypothetical protein
MINASPSVRDYTTLARHKDLEAASHPNAVAANIRFPVVVLEDWLETRADRRDRSCEDAGDRQSVMSNIPLLSSLLHELVRREVRPTLQEG